MKDRAIKKSRYPNYICTKSKLFVRRCIHIQWQSNFNVTCIYKGAKFIISRYSVIQLLISDFFFRFFQSLFIVALFKGVDRCTRTNLADPWQSVFRKMRFIAGLVLYVDCHGHLDGISQISQLQISLSEIASRLPDQREEMQRSAMEIVME